VESCAKTIVPTQSIGARGVLWRVRIEGVAMDVQQARPEQEVPTAASVWLVMMKAHRSLQALMEHSIASLGIGLSDFMILEALLHKGPMRISALGEKVHLANASMTAAVDRMADRGLVNRVSGTNDRRVRTVDLTPCGRALIDKLYRKHEHDIDTLMAPLCPAERSALRTSLKRVGLAAQAALQVQTEPSETSDPA
jgi:MarR family 2-MHQ and catechol resistance regulon transcriptional repressor